jgi:hypothetical protein
MMYNKKHLELQISLSDESTGGLIELKKYIAKQELKGVVSTELLQDTVKTGQMGILVIMDSLVTTTNVVESPIEELIKCLQDYVDSYRTYLTITTKEGIVIEINHGRSLKPEQLRNLLK